MGAARAMVRTVTAGGPHVPGWLGTPRLLLLTALAVGYLARRPDDEVVWLPVAVLLLVTAVEPLVRRLVPRPMAAHLPGFAQPGTPAAALVVPAALAALALVALAVLLSLPVWLVALAATVHAGVAAVALLQGARAYAGRSRSVAALRAAVAGYAPEYVLYTARGNGAYQLQMWLPHLEALGRRHVVVTRDPAAVAPIARTTGAPVIACPRWRDLDSVVVPSMRAAFYVNSIAANADFVTYRQLTHVYLGHGESDKALSHHPAHAMYDLVFVSGPAAVERYSRHGIEIPERKFVVVGNPQATAVHRAAAGPVDPEAAAVLYAPTWQGYNDDASYSSLSQGVALVEALLRMPGTVVFRPHPFSRTRPQERRHVEAVQDLLASDARSTGRKHVWDVDETFAESANRSTAMVADLSSIVTEYLASDKPVAIVTDGTSDFRDRHPVAAAAYLVDPELGNLEAVLADAMGADPLRAERAAVRARYVGAEGDAAFGEAVLSVLDAPPRPSGTEPASG